MSMAMEFFGVMAYIFLVEMSSPALGWGSVNCLILSQEASGDRRFAMNSPKGGSRRKLISPEAALRRPSPPQGTLAPPRVSSLGGFSSPSSDEFSGPILGRARKADFPRGWVLQDTEGI